MPEELKNKYTLDSQEDQKIDIDLFATIKLGFVNRSWDVRLMVYLSILFFPITGVLFIFTGKWETFDLKYVLLKRRIKKWMKKD